MPAYGEFRLSISKAMTDQLHEALHALEPAPLTLDNLEDLPQRQGVYQLYLADDLVYVGSASASLRGRLTQHFWKLAGRQNIAADEVAFTCLYVDEDLTVLAPEDRLIRVFQDEGSCEWNGNGFGLHDPGRNRDGTVLSAGHFDLRYPVRLDWKCDDIEAGEWTALELLRALKKSLPYLLRYANTASDRAAYEAATIDVPEEGMEATELFELIADELAGYQITALPGYVIMYRENRDYPQAEFIWVMG